MRDYNKHITHNSYEKFLNYAIENNCEIKQIIGVLNDTYIIYNEDKKLSVKGTKPRNFIVLYPKFKNAWENTFHILMTDDESKLDDFLDNIVQIKGKNLIIKGSKINLISDDKFNELFDLLGDEDVVLASDVKVGYVACCDMLFDFDDNLIKRVIEGEDVEAPYISLVSECDVPEFIDWYYNN